MVLCLVSYQNTMDIMWEMVEDYIIRSWLVGMVNPVRDIHRWKWGIMNQKTFSMIFCLYRSEDNVPIDDEFDEVELADLKTVATLGVGGFGRVNLVRHFDSDRVYALKILNKRHIKEMNQANCFWLRLLESRKSIAD